MNSLEEVERWVLSFGARMVLVSGGAIAQYAPDSPMSKHHAMVSLVGLGWADQNDVAKAFGHSRSLRRARRVKMLMRLTAVTGSVTFRA